MAFLTARGLDRARAWYRPANSLPHRSITPLTLRARAMARPAIPRAKVVLLPASTSMWTWSLWMLKWTMRKPVPLCAFLPVVARMVSPTARAAGSHRSDGNPGRTFRVTSTGSRRSWKGRTECVTDPAGRTLFLPAPSLRPPHLNTCPTASPSCVTRIL